MIITIIIALITSAIITFYSWTNDSIESSGEIIMAFLGYSVMTIIFYLWIYYLIVTPPAI